MTDTDTPLPNNREFAVNATLAMANLLKTFDTIGSIMLQNGKIRLSAGNDSEFFAQTKKFVEQHDIQADNSDVITLDFSGDENNCREIVEGFSQAAQQKLELKENLIEYSSAAEIAVVRLALLARGNTNTKVEIDKTDSLLHKFTIRDADAAAVDEIADFFPGASVDESQPGSIVLDIPLQADNIHDLRANFGKLALSAVDDINRSIEPQVSDTQNEPLLSEGQYRKLTRQSCLAMAEVLEQLGIANHDHSSSGDTVYLSCSDDREAYQRLKEKLRDLDTDQERPEFISLEFPEDPALRRDMVKCLSDAVLESLEPEDVTLPFNGHAQQAALLLGLLAHGDVDTDVIELQGDSSPSRFRIEGADPKAVKAITSFLPYTGLDESDPEKLVMEMHYAGGATESERPEDISIAATELVRAALVNINKFMDAQVPGEQIRSKGYDITRSKNGQDLPD